MKYRLSIILLISFLTPVIGQAQERALCQCTYTVVGARGETRPFVVQERLRVAGETRGDRSGFDEGTGRRERDPRSASRPATLRETVAEVCAASSRENSQIPQEASNVVCTIISLNIPEDIIPPPKLTVPKLQIPLLTLQPFTGTFTRFKTPQEFQEGEKRFLLIDYLANYLTAFYTFLVGISAVLAGIMIIWAGVKWLTAAGNPEGLSSARQKIAGAAVGLVLTLGSYVIVQILNPELVIFKPLRVELLERKELPEMEVEPSSPHALCRNPNNPKLYPAGSICEAETPCNENNPCIQDSGQWCCACLDCLKIPPELPRESQGDRLYQGTIAKLNALLTCAKGWTITEAYPPRVKHLSRGHYNGQAVDIALRPRIIARVEQMNDAEKGRYKQVKDCLTASGFKITDEYAKTFSTTTGPHFHLEP